MGTVVEKFQYIEGTKQAIKQAIKNKGVDVSDADTFRSYAEKIKEIGSGSGGGGGDTFEARNDLGVTEIESGTKVLIQPLEQQGGLVVKFSNASQKENWVGLCLYPYSTTRLMCDVDKTFGTCGVFSWTEETGLEEIYSTTTDVKSSGTYMYATGLKFFSNSLVMRYDCGSTPSSSTQYYWTNDAVTAGTQDCHIYNDGFGAKGVYSGNWTLWKVNGNGEFTEQIGQDVSGSKLDRYSNAVYVSPNGKYVVEGRNGIIWENENGSLTKIATSSNLKSIVQSKSNFNVLGGTSDGKYMIVNRYTSSADSNGIRNFPALIEISDDYQTYTEYTDLDITGLPTWYSWLQTLCVKNALGVVRMFKYADGKWEEISIDFPDTFTSGCDNRVTLNYDGSQICVTDGTRYNTGAVYLYNLEVTANGYKAVPYTPHNFNTKSYTAYATGNITANTVEVNALLPTLDNMEYDSSIVIKPSVLPDVVIPE